MNAMFGLSFPKSSVGNPVFELCSGSPDQACLPAGRPEDDFLLFYEQTPCVIHYLLSTFTSLKASMNLKFSSGRPIVTLIAFGPIGLIMTPFFRSSL